ncbi:phenylalanine--tRNA ligase subunit alpha [Mycoplasma zalophidermidis]|uniref:phenylalanine--tRNA ligase subunit alpha n=1 Tax=Mycoplasma zalophidermidis TaxID=398174 RepID=UPI001C0FC148|nr:phenylalanine--tRNA ligase subunit alpha [Mycoplasma zalophidermidis]MBU4689946.1 phenylalanine--tRNA ligase subunit alpha [Mycoplasma zalophidermidis]MCR8966769.1 phenylalanine--tRNA ligase subunit alpha [Mycoplasma zalophidermidis]
MKINIEEINTFEELKIAKNKIYGKEGELAQLQIKLKTAPNDKKREIGQQINKIKSDYEQLFQEAEKKLEDKRIDNLVNNTFIDVTQPTITPGSLHPITIIENRMRDWFIQNGYFESTAGEICSDYYNFEKLNMPSDHPARAMHDSLYLNPTTLLRTHNTGISAAELEKNANKPLNNFAIGKVYRNDEDDATHSHQFTQLDFVSVGNVSFPNLIWTLKSLLSYVFEEELELRLRPSFFPFTEPSVEVDIFYKNRWIEVLGAGMLHPNVMKLAGYDNKKYNGFAAGVGIERIAMVKYGIKDIREFYTNDLRTLNQFNAEK